MSAGLIQNRWKSSLQFSRLCLERKTKYLWFVQQKLNDVIHVPHLFHVSLSSLALVPLFLFCGFAVETDTRKIKSNLRRLFWEQAEVLVVCTAPSCWISHKCTTRCLISSSPLQCDPLKNQNHGGDLWSVRPWWNDLDYGWFTIIYIMPQTHTMLSGIKDSTPPTHGTQSPG